MVRCELSVAGVVEVREGDLILSMKMMTLSMSLNSFQSLSYMSMS